MTNSIYTEFTEFTVVDRYSPNIAVLNKAGRIIRNGGLVAFPTETVYGLGADALNPDAVRRIYEAKGRPSDNPLILHVAGLVQAKSLVETNDLADMLMTCFWPGPLTLVLPSRDCVPEITRGGLETAAVRMPRNIIARGIITAADTPIAAPSANLSGRPSPTNGETVYHDMNGKIDMIVDGGTVQVGIESTVIDVTNPEHVLLLRPGGLGREKIERLIGRRLYVPDAQSAKRSPGTRYRHYAPSIPVKIWHKDSGFPESDYAFTGYLGLHEPPIETAKAFIFADYAEYARELFSSFRQIEREGYRCIIAEWPDNDLDICAGLRDRILRAAYV